MNAVASDTQQPGYVYNHQAVNEVLSRVIESALAAEVKAWLKQKGSQADDAVAFNSAFVQMPRKTGRLTLNVSTDDAAQLQKAVPGFTINDWSIDRLCRVWLLLQLDASDKDQYTKRIETLFLAGEMRELVSLYSALPLLGYPQHWKRACAEGIRSNIGDVLQAIMCNNPFPSDYLDEAAWNQMVLKAFFTEKKVEDIIGLDRRANPELAAILLDYAHERWAAHRLVNPQLWRCVGPFITEKNSADIERLFASENRREKEAAALACNACRHAAAKLLLEKNKELKQAIDNGSLTWNSLSA